MNRTTRLTLTAASLGAAYCLYLILGFIRTIAENRLPWGGSALFTRDHYLAVGQAYGRGFAIGFFFCFCLAVVAFVIGTWYEKSVKIRRAAVA
jgi:hypothetical protein